MNASGIRTHNQILDAALLLFAEKGFASVTMSDFCTICKLSRGGLYRHFNSTGEIFVEMLMRDKDEWSHALEEGIKNKVSAKDMLRPYFKYSLEGIDKKDGRLSLAAYEYVRSDMTQVAFATDRYHAAVTMMRDLLDYGVSTGEFAVADTDVMARHLVIFMDGLRIASIFSIDENDPGNQVNFLYKSITGEDYYENSCN